MQRRKRKRFRAAARVPLVLPTRANEMWTMDYTHDELAGGRKFRTLNLMDGYTREALPSSPIRHCPVCAWCAYCSPCGNGAGHRRRSR
jgi:hypothetical protein